MYSTEINIILNKNEGKKYYKFSGYDCLLRGNIQILSQTGAFLTVYDCLQSHTQHQLHIKMSARILFSSSPIPISVFLSAEYCVVYEALLDRY